MRKMIILFATFLVLLGIFSTAIYFNSKLVAPTNFKINYQVINDEQIPDNFDNFNVLFFSDLEYGELFNNEHLELLANTINLADADVIIFGGDLFDENYQPNSQDSENLTNFLNSLQAPSGKFAILGDYDVNNENRELLINSILSNGDFEIISGTIKLYNNPTGYIYLSGYSFSQEIEKAAIDSYNIVVVHGNDMALQVSDNADIVLSGHSHDSQINIPFYNRDYKFGFNGNIFITKGVGLTKSDIRLFCNPEIVLLQYR